MPIIYEPFSGSLQDSFQATMLVDRGSSPLVTYNVVDGLNNVVDGLNNVVQDL